MTVRGGIMKPEDFKNGAIFENDEGIEFEVIDDNQKLNNYGEPYVRVMEVDFKKTRCWFIGFADSYLISKPPPDGCLP